MGKDFAPPKDMLEFYLQKGKKLLPNFYDQLLIIQSSHNVDGVLSELKSFVQKCTVVKQNEGITASQLRNIYSKLRNAPSANALKMKRPVLAYLAARLQRNEPAQIMIAVLDDLIKQTTDSSLTGFKSLMEAIVAYHKYFDSLKPKNN